MSLVEHAGSVLETELTPATLSARSFVDLGGDSLRAMRLAALAQQHAGLRIPVADLLSDTPLADVLARFGSGGETPPAGARDTAVPSSPPHRMSPSQRGMWLTERVLGGSPYNLVFSCVVEEGELDRDLFDRALAATVARHPGLRTVYREQGDEVTPVVDPAYRHRLDDVEHDGPAEEFPAFVRALAAERGRCPFDLAARPAYQFLFVQNRSGGQAVVLLAHHIVLDAWSIGLVFKEVFGRYAALRDGTAPPVTGDGPDISVLLAKQAADRDAGTWDRQADFWREHLAGVPTVLEVPGDLARPAVQDPAGDRLPVDLGTEVSPGVAAAARAAGVTPFTVLLGAYALTLGRWTGARSMVIGVSLLGRDSPELTELVAVTGNLVPVRVDIDDDLPVAGYLRSVQESLAKSIDMGDLPFEEVVTLLGVERGLGAHPLVQASFGLHDTLIPQCIDAGGVTVRVEEGHGGGAQFDVSLLFGRSEPTLLGQLEYATSVWQRAEAEAFASDYRSAVEALTGDTTGVLANVRCTSLERLALADALNRTREEFPAKGLGELFADVVARVPDAVAVRDGDDELTYAQLAAAAGHQAALLRELGVRPGDRVLVGLERSVAEIVGLLGIVLAGAAYVGVELNQPRAQLDAILAKAAPRAALVAGPGPAGLADRGVPLCASWTPDWTGEPVGAQANQDALAYVAFTSGSTGLPKGVCVPHRAVTRLVHEPDFVRLAPGDRMLRLSPLAFDASTLEIWGALLNGATLEVYPAGIPSPGELGAFLLDREITVAWLTAGLFRLVEEFRPEAFATLRQLVTGGDVVPHEHVAKALTRHPDLIITNGYGPTENTTFTLTHTVRAADEVDGPLPIGTPVPGTRVHVLDDRYRLVPPGGIGELYAAGAGLADGYLDDPAETAKAFGRFSPDVPERLYRTGDLVRLDTRGRIQFLGRRDHQIKLRGYRIELSAVADALTEDNAVKDAVVVVTDADSADKRIVAAVVTVDDQVTATALRDRLAERLPGYMVPTLWAMVDQIPVTDNGKVDRKAIITHALPAGAASRPAAPAPAAAEPEGLTTVLPLFVLALDSPATDVGPDTDFFISGGNSMGAVRLIRLLREQLGVSVRLRDFLLAPTPSGLVTLVEKAGTDA
ncbi:non-ribosomal peptide synthetase [Lentzea guizhouensis]|uniref:Non-ribosomal peptide synthetase n=1 Tax=Lentzea guizhouensis TaxID=1586287 RepID=A0A1B2HSB5_9PSEU|nr:non-ribosomal peptide synthetase [Lentzea guizhouensis]ANZ40591.1 non-ribosomal peptide synthetase [Lentzea guizhouensis]